jgi:hypothetical protein
VKFFLFSSRRRHVSQQQFSPPSKGTGKSKKLGGFCVDIESALFGNPELSPRIQITESGYSGNDWLVQVCESDPRHPNSAGELGNPGITSGVSTRGKLLLPRPSKRMIAPTDIRRGQF